jgi:hypothetical protein
VAQTSKDVQDIIDTWFPYQGGDADWFGLDNLCRSVLLSKGWTEHAGMFSPPTPSYYGPREDYVLLKYLVEEWDYAHDCAPLV